MMKMSHELGNKEKIYQLLEKEPLTSTEIAEKLKISEDPEKNIQFIRTYLQRLINANLIESNDKKGRYQVYTTIEKNRDFQKIELMDKLILLMVKAGINSEMYGIDIKESEIESNIKRLREGGKIG